MAAAAAALGEHARAQGSRAGSWASAHARRRLARSLKKLNRHDAALATYKQLEALDTVPVNGTPASLLARDASTDLLGTLQRTQEANRLATSIQADRLGHASLRAGTWTR